MISIVWLLVAAALVSQYSGFETNAQLDNSKLSLDNNIQRHEKNHSKRPRRIRKFVKIFSVPMEIQRVAGERVELECVASGNPAPSVIWEKNGQRLDSQYEDEINEFQTLKLSLAELHSKIIITSMTPGEDTYTCIATSGPNIKTTTSIVYTLPAVEDDEADFVALQKMSLLTPTITSYYHDILQDIGTSVVLPCRAQSTSKLVVFWQDVDNRLIYDNPRMKVLPSGDLKINNLDFVKDMGNYTCVAKNTFGKDSIVTFVYPVLK